MATFLVLRGKLRVRLGNPTTASVPDSELNENLNDAYRDVATKFRHHKARKLFDFSTVIGTADYALPVDAGALIEVWDIANKRKLVRKGFRRRVFEASPKNGKPLDVYRFRNFITLDPPPDAVVTIRLWLRENITDLAIDGDVPVTPTTWDTGILLLARWYHYEGRHDTPQAVTALRAYEIWIKDRPTEIEEEMQFFDSGVELPTLVSQDPRLDFDRSP